MLLAGCYSQQKISSQITGKKFRWVDAFEKEFETSCEIYFNSSSTFTYHCRMHHFGTTAKGVWKVIPDKKLILIEVTGTDILPTYPEKFYKTKDTILILSETIVSHNGKVFKSVE